jgi:hypothetical protein
VPAGRASPKHRNLTTKWTKQRFQMSVFFVFSILFRYDAVLGQRVKPDML